VVCIATEPVIAKSHPCLLTVQNTAYYAAPRAKEDGAIMARKKAARTDDEVADGCSMGRVNKILKHLPQTNR
jgi:hypothetical protein